MSLDEELNKEGREIPFKEKSEVAEVFDNLDSVDQIDKNTRLSPFQIHNLIVTEELIRRKILPDLTITEKVKSLNISKDGKGREEKVSVFRQREEQRQGGNILTKMFSKRND